MEAVDPSSALTWELTFSRIRYETVTFLPPPLLGLLAGFLQAVSEHEPLPQRMPSAHLKIVKRPSLAPFLLTLTLPSLNGASSCIYYQPQRPFPTLSFALQQFTRGSLLHLIYIPLPWHPEGPCTPCSPGSLNPCAAPLLLWLLSTSHELLSPHPNWPWFSSPPSTIATFLMKRLPCSAAFQLPGGVQASGLDSLLSTLSFLCFILGSLTSFGINPACKHTSL